MAPVPGSYTRPTSKPSMTGSSSGASRAAHRRGADSCCASTSSARRSRNERSSASGGPRKEARPVAQGDGDRDTSSSERARSNHGGSRATPPPRPMADQPYSSVVCSSLRKAERARSAVAGDPAAWPPALDTPRRPLEAKRRAAPHDGCRHAAATATTRPAPVGSDDHDARSEPPAHPELERRRAEAEVLPDLALEVAQVGGRQVAVGEQGERGRVGRALGGVEDPTRGRRMGGLGGLQHLVQLAGGHPAVVRLDGLLQGGQQLVHAQAGEGADLEHRGVAEEGEPVGHVGHDVEPASASSSLPLVEHDDDRAAGGVDALGQALVLVGHALGGVDDEQGGVGPVDGLQGPHQRVVLGALVDLRLAPHPGGVDEAQRPVVGLDHGVDGVAGRARHVVHDRALVADEPVEQRRLADVGPARRWRHRPIRRRSSAGVVGRSRRPRSSGGEAADQRVEQVAGAPAVQGADRPRVAEAEAA